MSTVRQLATLMGQGRVLPEIRFFEPKLRFLKWMRKTFDGKLIYDIGAGCGHVAKDLSELGLEVKAIDIHYRESGVGFPVEISNAETYAYKPDSIAMIARIRVGSSLARLPISYASATKALSGSGATRYFLLSQ